MFNAIVIGLVIQIMHVSDIFGFEGNGKMVDHWDVLRVTSGSANNTNGLFKVYVEWLPDFW